MRNKAGNKKSKPSEINRFLKILGPGLLRIIGTGLLAIPVLTGCLSYMLSETFNWNGDLDKKYYQAKPFYWVIIISLLLGLAINYIGINPIQALLYTAILYGVTSPVLIVLILHISNNKKVMGKFTNGKWSNILGGIRILKKKRMGDGHACRSVRGAGQAGEAGR